MKKKIEIEYEEYASEEGLPIEDQKLIDAARRATEGSYSPYSHFRVGAALRMKDGAIEIGSNQENLAYPSGLCAERVALFGASARYGEGCVIEALAITAVDAEGESAEASPCGACRQVMIEQEQRQNQPLRTLVSLADGRVREYLNASDLLPFVFCANL